MWGIKNKISIIFLSCCKSVCWSAEKQGKNSRDSRTIPIKVLCKSWRNRLWYSRIKHKIRGGKGKCQFLVQNWECDYQISKLKVCVNIFLKLRWKTRWMMMSKWNCMKWSVLKSLQEWFSSSWRRQETSGELWKYKMQRFLSKPVSVCVGIRRKFLFIFFKKKQFLRYLEQQERDVRYLQGLHTTSVNAVEAKGVLIH